MSVSFEPPQVRFKSIDPLTKQYPQLSPYQFASNRPIDGVDLDGLEFSKYWNKNDVQNRTNQLISNPLTINQGGGGTCTIAAVTYLFIKEQPKKFAQAVNDLYDKGYTTANDYEISAKNFFGKDLDGIDPSKTNNLTLNSKQYSTDWIILSSIQNSENSFYNYYGTTSSHDRTAEGNYPSDVKNLMKNLLGYKDVKQVNIEDDKNADIATIVKNINQDRAEGYNQILDINAKLLQPNNEGRHNVTLLTPITSKTENRNKIYSFDVQTWGGKTTINANEADLKKYFYDYTSGK